MSAVPSTWGAPPGYPPGAKLNYSMGWIGNTYSGGFCNDTQKVHECVRH
jgi:hypothetical protein